MSGLPFHLAYFGANWGAPMLEGAVQVPTPIGAPCLHCTEPIAAGEQGVIRYAIRVADLASTKPCPVHAECDAIAVIGHTYGVCSCTGFDTTLRSSARELWRRMAAGPPDPDVVRQAHELFARVVTEETPRLLRRLATEQESQALDRLGRDQDHG